MSADSPWPPGTSFIPGSAPAGLPEKLPDVEVDHAAMQDAAVSELSALERRVEALENAIADHRAANTSNCNNLACEKGCGHDLRLYAVLDEA